MLADVKTNETLPADELQLCPNEFGPVAIFPMSATRRRIVATIEKEEGDAPSLDLVQKILSQRAPGGIEALALHWSNYFRIQHRQVAQLRIGRIFIESSWGTGDEIPDCMTSGTWSGSSTLFCTVVAMRGCSRATTPNAGL
jgi:hypothetical protein